MQRSQAGGTCRIDYTVGAAEIEAVGDAACDHISQQAGKGVFGPFGIILANACDCVLDPILRNTCLEHGLAPLGVVEAGP